ncbi:MAG: DUF1987 domain-containing protein [Chlorobi bacterium]|nr:DUF1987 domain-containing protein [Chlorobiota bacterium]
MDALIIDSTEDTPQVILDPKENNFILSERSLPENAIEFYKPIFEWLNKYKNDPNKLTTFNFKLDYFNTASAKQITKILLFLENLAINHEVKVLWSYQKDDLDMKSSGTRFAKLIKVKIDLVEI